MSDIKKLLESIDRIAQEGTMASATRHKTGPKFGGYWKGTDPNPPKPGMGVGGTDESDEHFTYEEGKAYLGDPHIREEDDSLDPPGYALRVAELENEGMTTSDAQGIADMEYQLKIGPWKKDKEIVNAIGKQVSEDDGEEGIEECPACDGRGVDYGETCIRCGGKGHLRNGEYDAGDNEVEENYLGRMEGGASGIVGEDGEGEPLFNEDELDEDSWSDGVGQWSSGPNAWGGDGKNAWSGSAVSEDEEELYSGCYVRDEQNDGPNGEVFKMSGDPYERRVRIEDKDGRGWNISPSRLILVDENDPAVRKWFGRNRGDDDLDEAAKPASLMARVKEVAPGDQVSKDKDGNFIFRQGYYYRMGMDSQKFAARVKDALEKSGLKVEIIDHGDHWAAFRGGASVKQSSHFWVKARITDTIPAVTAAPIEEADIPDIERNRALAGAKVDDRADPEKMAIWWSHYRRAIGNKQNDKQARDYADRMTATEPKFRPNPFVAKESMDAGDFLNTNWGLCKAEDGAWYVRKLYRRPLCIAGPFDTMLDANINRLSQDFKDDYDVAQYSSAAHDFVKPVKEESVEEITEELKAAFEDYVSNEKYSDDTLYPPKSKKAAADKKKVKKPKVVDPNVLGEGASSQEVGDAIAYRISRQKPELITKYGVEVLADAIDQVASFHAGAEELGTSDISIMVNQVVKDLESSYVKEDTRTNAEKLKELRNKLQQANAAYSDSKDSDDAADIDHFRKEIRQLSRMKKSKKELDEDVEGHHISGRWENVPQRMRQELLRRSEQEKWERKSRDAEWTKQNPFMKDVEEAKFASRARSILQKKLDDLERMNKPVAPVKPPQQPTDKKPLDEEEAMMPHAVQLFQLMQPETRKEALNYLDSIRKNYGPEKSLQTYRMAQKMKQANKNMPKNKEVEEDAPQIDPTTGKPIVQPAPNTATPITTPKTTAQQPPAPKGTPTAIPAPGQPTLPTAGQAGGAPVAPPPGTPKPETGSGVNTTTTPIQGLATSLQQLAQPGAQMAAKKAADALARVK